MTSEILATRREEEGEGEAEDPGGRGLVGGLGGRGQWRRYIGPGL